jgi:glutaconyl-CoA/methylmalonyl-CoA decarboxylase subunit gamma
MKVSVNVDGQTYEVEIQDINKRPIVAIVDGEAFEIQPETELGASPASEPAKGTMPAPAKTAETTTQTLSGKTLLAPLPGTVTEIFVLPGAQVETGQPVCVIEAMKMKNTIRTNRSGTIASVSISPGQSVKHKQVLVEFND